MTQPFTVLGSILELHAARAHLGVSQGHNQGAETQWFDTSGSGNHGTLTSFAGTTSSGWAGTGTLADPHRLVFDGSSDFVACPDLSACEDKTFTYEAWIVDSTGTSGDSRVAISEWADADAPLAWLGLGTTGIPAFSMFGNAWSNQTEVNSNVAVNNGQPHHLVGTCDATTARLYVDATEKGAPASATSVVLTGCVNTMVGKWATGWFPGGIMAARIYPFALTPAQVAQNFAAGYLWPLDWNPGGPGVYTTGPYIKIGSFDIPVVA